MSQNDDENDKMIHTTDQPDTVLSLQFEKYRHIQEQSLSLIRIIIAALALLAVVVVNEEILSLIVDTLSQGEIDFRAVSATYDIHENTAESIIYLMFLNGAIYIMIGANVFLLSLILFARTLIVDDLEPAQGDSQIYRVNKNVNFEKVNNQNISSWINTNNNILSNLVVDYSRAFKFLTTASVVTLLGIFIITTSISGEFDALFSMNIISFSMLVVLIVEGLNRLRKIGVHNFYKKDRNIGHYFILLPSLLFVVFLGYITYTFCSFWIENVIL